MPARFTRFNVVGALGTLVQLACAQLLVGVLHVHYLVGALLATEISVLHNFAWHERWTWRSRLTVEPLTGNGHGRRGQASGTGRSAGVLLRGAAFHAGNGCVSLLGTFVLMPVFVETLGLPYLVANLAAIATTGIVNFLVADRLVFRQGRSRCRTGCRDGERPFAVVLR